LIKNKFGDEAIHKHFIAVTASSQHAITFGIQEQNIFPVWDWIGGRYSIWSAIGLPLMLMIGNEQFTAFLEGAYDMDMHFRHSELSHNIPVLMALLSIWYTNFYGANAQAVVPYSHRLRYLIPYLQQAEMESNGKRTDLHGNVIEYNTGPIIFGQEGCDGQHAYHQSLHQGQHLIPVDFIIIGHAECETSKHHHDILIASGLSQAQALMRGKTLDEIYHELLSVNHSPQKAAELAPHKVIPGNKPSNILLMHQMNPRNLGTLIALFEHKIFTQSVIWNINAFDQWGVELGKQLLPDILQQVQHESKETAIDPAITGLIHHLKKTRGDS
jgi:glucose-6-phosphate isomerase